MKVFEDVEMRGHIIDSLLLPKVLDEVTDHGGDYEILKFDIGKRSTDPSYVRLRILAREEEHLRHLLSRIQRLGANPVAYEEVSITQVEKDGVLPDGFYITTNLDTEIYVAGKWIKVENPEMDCAVVVREGSKVECVRMGQVEEGDKIVVGKKGVRVIPLEKPSEGHIFAFMTSSVSSEKPKSPLVAQVASRMKEVKVRGEKILFVCGPAVVHTGAKSHLCALIRNGYVDVLFAGNALAVHDVESELFGTSLGLSLREGVIAQDGHEHHLRAINIIRKYGSIARAIDSGVIRDGIMYHLIKRGKPFVLAGSIRDDGPLPEVITDSQVAQTEMRKNLQGIGMVLMLSTMLHSIAVANMLPARIFTVCVDMNPQLFTKLTDRGSRQILGLMTDVGLFLRELTQSLISRED